MYDEVERNAQRVGTTVCYDQVDWPFASGTLRDGTEMPGQRFQDSCPIFERLPAFRYRLKHVNFRTPAQNSPTTSDEGGDCHMARATQRATTTHIRCKLHGKNETATVLQCEDGSYATLQLEKSKAPEWVIEHARSRRRRCADVDDVPGFFSQSGHAIPNASSFGLHARISSERFLASDLHHILCTT
eukprot:3261023-Rhodomonas_salina.1